MGTHCKAFKPDYSCEECAKAVKGSRNGIKYAAKMGRPNGIEAASLRGHIHFIRSFCTNPEIHGWKKGEPDV